MALADQKLASKKLTDTIYNTVTAMASRLVRYNHTESNALVSIIKLYFVWHAFIKEMCTFYFSSTKKSL